MSDLRPALVLLAVLTAACGDDAGPAGDAGLADEPNVGRYHSLIVESSSLPDCLSITAQTDENEIMGLRHSELPVWGVQFHPESLATEKGIMILKNFLEFC